MILERKNKASNFKEYVCDLTKELDKLAWPQEKYRYDKYSHYILDDNVLRKDKYLAIRVPGGTVGNVDYDDELRILDIVIEKDYIVKTYPDNVNEIMKKYIGMKLEFGEN